jgi:hypothetical protein
MFFELFMKVGNLKCWMLYALGAATLVATGNVQAQWDDDNNPSDG